jgi:hypothetical protein
MGIPSLRRAAVLVATVASVAVVGTACTSSGRSMAPVCNAVRFDPLILVAQSVPSAEKVPCIVVYPAGWSLARVDVRRGRTTFDLKSDRISGRAVKVTFEDRCDTGGAMQVFSDELGTVRHDRRIPDDDGFRETRLYTFAGGCVSYEFGFRFDPTLQDETSLTLGFLSRAQIDAKAREATGGRIHL